MTAWFYVSTLALAAALGFVLGAFWCAMRTGEMNRTDEE